MVIIEIFVYAFIASMMVVCVNYVKKAGYAEKSDSIYFWVMFSLILTQIFIQILPTVRNSVHPFTQICLGTIVTLAFIYVITRIAVPSIDTQKRVRAWTGWAMFFTTEFCVCALLMGFPETKTDLYRMPLPLALCIAIKYYPPMLDRLKASRNSSEQSLAEHEEPIIDTATAIGTKEHKETVLDIATESSIEKHKDTVISLAIESWRFAKVFERGITQLNAARAKRHTSQLQLFLKKTEESLEDVGLRIVNVEGQPYDPGMAATPLNIEDFEPEDHLVVDQMLEPIIMHGGSLAQTGTVTLRRIE